MIKVGDKVIWQSEEWEVYSIEEHIVELRRIEDGFGIGTKVDLKFLESNYYKQLYEQQKHRADELEKQNDILKHNIRVELDSNRSMYINMCDEKHRADRAEKRWKKLKEHFVKQKEQSFSILSWSRNNGMLELMEKFEEDGE